MVFRVYVEKRDGFQVEAAHLYHELTQVLGITRLQSLRIINRYDVDGISQELFNTAVRTVFSEPPVDHTFTSLSFNENDHVFAVEFLPGQFDQRAQSASECIQLISQCERPEVRSAKIIICTGSLTTDDVNAIKHYVINPVEAREASLEAVNSLTITTQQPADVQILKGFTKLDAEALSTFINEHGLAMDVDDAQCCQQYFIQEHRDPTITEIRVIDTYWSDHCRHTTFGTELTDITIDDKTVNEAFQRYLAMRDELGRNEKPLCLMDMATIGARYLKKHGILTNLDESDEINACTVRVNVDVNGHDEDWLFLFKNETHNHPTEIEPFGGAATCIGGCIRDPLSGRAYVYQAMRVTGAADPRTDVRNTLNGKLAQRTIVTNAANGYASYGNQIGLATGEVHELYHPGYVAKRMEVGAVVAATPADHVRRETPTPGDVIILLGGRTGRDGIGGATGSSQAQQTDSIEECGAQVQKGNAPVERKLQRLFRRKDACRMIKRCNDFGAGGVSVAAGELADGLTINLDVIPKKYEGLDGTELAIAESQERMAVDVAAQDAQHFLALAKEENLEATIIAQVTQEARMRMTWRGKTIVDLSRDFLSSNGAKKTQVLHITQGQAYHTPWQNQPGKPTLSFSERMQQLVSDINVACNKGLSERFDSTIGAATVLMPFGGHQQLTASQAMVAKFPVFGSTTTASAMAWGFNPYLMEANQFTGAYVAVVESIAKLVATGFTKKHAYLSLQEYFGKPRNDPKRWGKPAAALLGALSAQIDLGVGAIGGKDSMSGSFENLDVPPTLISFAVSTGDARNTVSAEFKGANHRIIRIAPHYLTDMITPERESFLRTLAIVESLTAQHHALAITTAGYSATSGALFQMTLGNHIGFTAAPQHALSDNDYFTPAYGSFIIELSDEASIPFDDSDLVDIELIGTTSAEYTWTTSSGEILDLNEYQERWMKPLENIFPFRYEGKKIPTVSAHNVPSTITRTHAPISHPHVIIPVFPGNNCEYDVQAAFEQAGAQAETLIIRNLTPQDITQSVDALVQAIKRSQIIMIPGGFSGGDEPDGSAKFIAAFFRHPALTDAVRDLLQHRDGLMLGICNGFQALIKLGLVPFGDIVNIDEHCPTLTFNTIGRHQSRIVQTRVASCVSPWLQNTKIGDIYSVPISHGEGRFIASDEMMTSLITHGQVATQYVNSQGVASMASDVNPNGSLMAVEGITSPDGRIFGKMGHCERTQDGLYLNIPSYRDQPLFSAGVDYFTA